MNDNDLYAAYRDGDNSAFDELVSRHRDRLVAIASRRLASADAEDVVQNAFIQLMRAASKFDPAKHDAAKWMTWLTLHRCRNEKRDRSRRPLLDNDCEPTILPEAVGQAELVDQFWVFVASQDGEHREMLVRAFVAGESQRDIATALHIDRSTIMRRMKAILPRLRRAVGEEFADLRSSLERRRQGRIAA